MNTREKELKDLKALSHLQGTLTNTTLKLERYRVNGVVLDFGWDERNELQQVAVLFGHIAERNTHLLSLV